MHAVAAANNKRRNIASRGLILPVRLHSYAGTEEFKWNLLLSIFANSYVGRGARVYNVR